MSKKVSDYDICLMLAKMLYSQPNCLAGGPLHIILDDFNIEDSNIDFCEKHLFEDEVKKDFGEMIVLLCLTFCNHFRKLSMDERAMLVMSIHMELVQKDIDYEKLVDFRESSGNGVIVNSRHKQPFK